MLRKYVFILVHLFLGPFISAMFLVALFKPETSIAIGIFALIGFIGYVLVMVGLIKLMDRWDEEDNNE